MPCEYGFKVYGFTKESVVTNKAELLPPMNIHFMKLEYCVITLFVSLPG